MQYPQLRVASQGAMSTERQEQKDQTQESSSNLVQPMQQPFGGYAQHLPQKANIIHQYNATNLNVFQQANPLVQAPPPNLASMQTAFGVPQHMGIPNRGSYMNPHFEQESAPHNGNPFFGAQILQSPPFTHQMGLQTDAEKKKAKKDTDKEAEARPPVKQNSFHPETPGSSNGARLFQPPSAQFVPLKNGERPANQTQGPKRGGKPYY